MIEQLLVFIAKGTATWALNQVLNEMYATAAGAASVNAKLDRLLASPFVAGKDHLDLARAYPDHSAEQRRTIEDARRSFHAAAAQLNGLEQCLASYMAGLCSDLLQDTVARRHYYSNALHVIPEYVAERIKSHNTAASRGQAVGIVAMAAGIAVAAAGVTAPIATPLFASGGMALQKSRDMKKRQPIPLEDVVPGTGFTVASLCAALEEAVVEADGQL